MMIARMLFTAGALALASLLPAQESAAPKADFAARPALYPLDTCVVSGEKLDADAVTFKVGDTEFRTCCEKCQAKVEKAPDAYKAKVEAAAIKAQLAQYPLDTCPISGEKLGGMGEPKNVMLDGVLVRLCCGHCTEKAMAKAEAIAARVRTAAHTAQRKSYPLDTCVVSGEKLDDTAVDVMYGTTLVRLCCEKCEKKFAAAPAEFLAKIAAAKAPAGDEHDHDGEHGKEHGEGHGEGHGKDHEDHRP